MDILVTGGTGLVGSHLLYNLTKSGNKVRAIRRDSSDLGSVRNLFEQLGASAEQWDKIDWFEADILDLPRLTEAVKGMSYVYHAAALVSFLPKDKYTMYEVNVCGTENLVNICLEHQVKKLVHVSSIAAIGRSDAKGVITEQNYWKDSKRNSNYAISKYNSELEVWRGMEEGLDVAVVNPGVILGPYFWGMGSSVIFDKAWDEFPFYTTGENAFVDVRDVVIAMEQLMNNSISGERFILAAGNYCFRDVLWAMADKMGKKRAAYEAGPKLRKLAFYLDWMKATLGLGKQSLTKETARSAGSKYAYSAAKAEEMLGIKFFTLEDMMDYSIPKYLKYKGK